MDKTTANNYLLDKYFNEIDDEHLTLKYQFTPEEVMRVENEYFDSFLTELGEKKGKDYVIRAISLKKPNNDKRRSCAIPNIVKDGGNSVNEDRMITMLKNISLSDSDSKLRIAVMFNMIFAIYDRWLFPAGIKNVPNWGYKYMQMLSDLYGKFDSETAEIMQKIIRGYISSVLKENGISAFDCSLNVFADYVQMLSLIPDSHSVITYSIIDYNSLLNYLSVYELNGTYMKGFQPDCLKQKRLQLWREIVDLRGKDFDMHGHTVERLEEIKNSLLAQPT